MTIEFTPIPSQGWECPKCGRVYAPWMANADRVQPKLLVVAPSSDSAHVAKVVICRVRYTT